MVETLKTAKKTNTTQLRPEPNVIRGKMTLVNLWI